MDGAASGQLGDLVFSGSGGDGDGAVAVVIFAQCYCCIFIKQ